MTREETKQVLKEINSIYPKYFNQDLLPTTLDMWQETFVDVEYDYVHKAIIEHSREGDKHPTINDIYKRAYQIKRDDFFAKGGRI